MKVWITAYALTRGIIEAEGEPCGLECVFVSLYNGRLREYFEQGEWFDTKERAIEKAEELRLEKIFSLERQIEKLERMRFE